MMAWTNITHLSRRALALLAVGVVTASAATFAAAAPIPAEHFPLMPLGGEPLQVGVDIGKRAAALGESLLEFFHRRTLCVRWPPVSLFERAVQ